MPAILALLISFYTMALGPMGYGIALQVYVAISTAAGRFV